MAAVGEGARHPVNKRNLQSSPVKEENVLTCSNPRIYTIVVQEVYNRDRSPEFDDVEGLAAAATKHLELIKQKCKADGSFVIEKIVGKLLRMENTRPFPLYQPPARFQWMRVSFAL